jgi:DNA repair protein RadC
MVALVSLALHVHRALELRAKSIIMVHNHPSGIASPSREDIEVTLAVQEAAKFMEIDLHDHIIVARNSYYSMRMEGDI